MCSDINIQRIFYGVFARDKLPKRIPKKPGILIVNTDTSNNEGEHWIAIYLGVHGRSEYFDSFGLAPRSNDIKKFLKKNSLNYIYNQKVLQPVFSETCGYFVFYYAHRKAKGCTMNRIVNNLRVYRPQYNSIKVTNFAKQISQRSL